jgi:hypothetical protein
MLSQKQEIFADSIYYENKDRKGQLYSNVQVTDTVQKTVALSDFADFDMNTEDFLMRKNPSIIIYDDKDSVFLRADTLYSITRTMKVPVIPVADSTLFVSDSTVYPQDTTEYVDSTYKELFAFGNAKLYRNDFQLICDSMYFNNLDSIWKVYHDPILWEGIKMQIISDSMKFYMINGDFDHADFDGNAMVVTPEGDPDSTIYFNQIKSKTMKAYLKNKKLTVFDAMGNLQTLAFSLTDYTMNKAEASSLKVIFYESGRVKSITYYYQVTADNNPLTLVREDEIKLPGYRWEIDLRPKSGDDVLNRLLRPSERTVKETLTKPSFPIMKRIEELEHII